jgi:glutathione synthase/RimK-type ligase-like ATP-grasp enzyme
VHILMVVNNPKNWPLTIEGVDVIQARRYLTDPAFMRMNGARVFNLCKDYRYQSTGYYVSLLAAARGHRPIPDVLTLRDLQSTSIIRLVSEELDELMQRGLAPIKSDTFTLSIYFGRNLAKRYDRLALQLFNMFRTPMLRADFVRIKKHWQLQNVSPISVSQVPDSHREFLVRVASEFFSGRRRQLRRPRPPRFTMAILAGPEDPHPPSDARAIRNFVRAAEKLDIDAEIITRDDLSRLPEYDGLFIRETTVVTNHTFRFARRAEAEGLVVIDDSESILRCTNKVYLAELLLRHKVRTPRTMIVHRDNLDVVPYEIGLPCILKEPDSSFSAGVIKVASRVELEARGREMLDKSELILAQEFLPTPFDWRIGIIDGSPLYACKYYMAGGHWQIIQHKGAGRMKEGRVEALPIEEAPREVVQMAVRAAAHVGNGLYGVDLKHDGKRCYVVEVNDNPSIEAGYEDTVLKDRLYLEIMGVFLRRMESQKQSRPAA